MHRALSKIRRWRLRRPLRSCLAYQLHFDALVLLCNKQIYILTPINEGFPLHFLLIQPYYINAVTRASALRSIQFAFTMSFKRVVLAQCTHSQVPERESFTGYKGTVGTAKWHQNTPIPKVGGLSNNSYAHSLTHTKHQTHFSTHSRRLLKTLPL